MLRFAQNASSAARVKKNASRRGYVRGSPWVTTKDFDHLIDTRVEACNIRVLCTFIAVLSHIRPPVRLADRARRRTRLSISVIGVMHRRRQSVLITYIQIRMTRVRYLNRAQERHRSALRRTRHHCRRRRRMRMMYQGRNFDHVSWLLIGDGAVDRAGSEGLLFLGRCAPLCQTLEALEGVINEYPVLVYYLAILWHRRGRCEAKRKNKVCVLKTIGCNDDNTGKITRTYL